MKGLALRRHHEKRIKEATLRYQELGHLLTSSKGNPIPGEEERYFDVCIKHSVHTLVDRKARVALGKACNRHGTCRCGRDHGMCSHTDKEHTRLVRHKFLAEKEEIRIYLQELQEEEMEARPC